MKWILLVLLFTNTFLIAQKTKVSGLVVEDETGIPIPFASVFFQDSKTGTDTDLDGKYEIDSYYATDSLIVRAFGFGSKTVAVKRDQDQVINFRLGPVVQTSEEVNVVAPKDKPSTILHKRVVRNKPINNKAKLEAYEYESYNKIQLDLNNIGDKFEERKIVKELDLIMGYLDTLNGGKYLPLILSESISDFYYRTNPTKKKEVIKASRITGVDNLELNHFLGDMYQDINVYDNYIGIFDKSFISPIADFARGYYTFYLEDSAFIDNQWCYLMTFSPKRKGDLTFKGEMWIHDTTYAVKKWSAKVNEDANINYVKGFYLEQTFNQIEPEVWMLTDDKLIVDLKVTKKSKILGFYGRKRTTKTNFVINQPRPIDFYKANENVVVLDSATNRNEAYWEKHRHIDLNDQEKGIDKMIDSLDRVPLFVLFKDLTYLGTTGFYRLNKIEIGNIKSLFSYNKVEGFRNQIQLRTSNKFSRRIELSSKLAYGYLDQEFKYGGGVRFNITPKKRGMLNVFYDYDVKQLGLGENAEEIDAAFGSLLRTKPLTMLNLVEKFGAKLEKDVRKSFIITVGTQWKELTKLGETQFRVPISSGGFKDIESIRTFETSLKIRYAKNEEFISGAFDRISVGSNYPILSLEGVFGIKGVLNSDYEYQKLEFQLNHSPRLGFLGTMYYEIYGGMYFGATAYPFLKIHEGSQTYWLQSTTHNRMDYFEFISDRYVGVNVEHHFNGLILNYIPILKRLKWRVVVSAKSIWGDLSEKQTRSMLLPDNTKLFGNIPYVESGVGIENIFKVFRIDAIWRVTHLDPGTPPVGIRGKFTIRF